MSKLSTSLIALLLCFTLTFTACSTSWITEAEQIVTALAPAAVNLITLIAALEGKGVSVTDLQTSQSVVTQVTNDLTLIGSLITEYQKADATAQPGILSKIQVAVADVQANLTGLLPALHIVDPATQAKVEAIVGLILSEVNSLAAIVPLVNAATPTAMVAKASTAVKVHPPLTASEFVSSYNSILTAKSGNPLLDAAAAKLKIHVHGKFVRWVTLGIAK